MRALRFTASAERDLIRLREFIAVSNPIAAKNIAKQLKLAISRLTEFPDIGVNVDGLSGIQDFVANDYVIRYMANKHELIVLRVWHSRENR